MSKLAIIGARGHGQVVADIARKNGYRAEDIFFLDDNEKLKKCGEYPVVGNTEMILDVGTHVFVAIGNAETRKRMSEKYQAAGMKSVTLIHPNAVVSESVPIGEGTVIMAGAVINPGAMIGKGCIINTCSSVDHESKVADYVHVAVGAHIASEVNVGEQTWIGAGVTVSNNVSIAKKCMIGAGAVVVKDIFEQGTYIGVPAQKLDR